MAKRKHSYTVVITTRAIRRWHDLGGRGKLTTGLVRSRLASTLACGAQVQSGGVEVEIGCGLKAIINRRQQGWKRPKQLMLLPSRLAIAMQEAGWLIRNDVIWHKTNGMPLSCKDRLSNRHEHLFHFTKGARYYYDLDAIRVPWEGDDLRQRWGRQGEYSDSARGNIPKFVTEEYKQWYHEQREKKSWHDHENDKEMGFGQQTRGQGRKQSNLPHPDGKNPGDVWTIPTKPFIGAHFATFPVELIKRPIKATCPPGGIVLDPFGGAGTTSLVAARHGRSSVYIDLNPEYREMAIKRLRGEVDQLSLFADHRIEVAG